MGVSIDFPVLYLGLDHAIFNPVEASDTSRRGTEGAQPFGNSSSPSFSSATIGGTRVFLSCSMRWHKQETSRFA